MDVFQNLRERTNTKYHILPIIQSYFYENYLTSLLLFFLLVRHVGNLEGRIVYKLDIQFTQPLPTYSDEEFNSHSKSIPRGLRNLRSIFEAYYCIRGLMPFTWRVLTSRCIDNKVIHPKTFEELTKIDKGTFFSLKVWYAKKYKVVHF